MTERPADRRRSRRIDVMLPVILDNARAVTRDASASGVFFWKRGTFMYGESIRFAIERMTGSGRVLQKCRGVVVRTEPDDEGVGIAARIIESTTEPAPGSLGGTDPRDAPREEPREQPREEPRAIVGPRRDVPASNLKTADRAPSESQTKPAESGDEPRTDTQPRDDALACDSETIDRSSPELATKPPEAGDRPRTVTQPTDDALASAIQTVDRWSWLLLKKALDACEELRGQEMLQWDFPSIAEAAPPLSGRVRVCSVTAVDLGSPASPDTELGGFAAESFRGLAFARARAELDARRGRGFAGLGDLGNFVKRRNGREGCGIRIELESCVANLSHEDRAQHKIPVPIVVVRMTAVRRDDRNQELDKSCYEQATYSDPAQAFEAFLALAGETAILINLDLREETVGDPPFRSAA